MLVEGAAHALAHARRAHVRREPPAHDVAGIPVDDAGQVHVGPPDGRVGDVDAPDLVRERYRLVLQQVGVLRGALGGLGQVGLGVDGLHV